MRCQEVEELDGPLAMSAVEEALHRGRQER